MLAIFISPLILGLIAVNIVSKFIETPSNKSENQLKLKNNLVVYFKSGTFEIEQRSLNNLFNKLDPSMFYIIQGYSCSNSRGSEEELLSEADNRAEIVKEHLIRKGFPENKLTTIAYDHSSECKVTLIVVEY